MHFVATSCLPNPHLPERAVLIRVDNPVLLPFCSWWLDQPSMLCALRAVGLLEHSVWWREGGDSKICSLGQMNISFHKKENGAFSMVVPLFY
jgi:hypothetical protein